MIIIIAYSVTGDLQTANLVCTQTNSVILFILTGTGNMNQSRCSSRNAAEMSTGRVDPWVGSKILEIYFCLFENLRTNSSDP